MYFKKNVVVFTILLCIFFSISCVVASDVNDTEITTYENQVIGDVNEELVTSPQDDSVSSSDDEVIASSQEDSVSSSADDVLADSQNALLSSSNKGTFSELQNIINTASDGATINLQRDYSYDNGFNNGSGIVINKSLTINGNGHTLDGLSKSRILFIMFGLSKNNKVTLNNIVFKNGYTKYYGGAIFSFAELTVNKCTFKKNYAGTTAGAICSLGSLICKNSKFDKNKAKGSGGAIFSLNIYNAVQYFNAYYKMYSNKISNGIIKDVTDLISTLMSNNSIKHSTDSISNCKFTNNVALGRGGGAVYAYSHIKIASSTFTSNKASQVGGAVYAAKNLNIKNSKFTKNKVSVYGGAVYFKSHDLSTKYENGKWKSSVKFYTGVVEKCVFKQNVAKDRGGAIYAFKYAKKPTAIKVVKSTFIDNQADTYNGVYGGALKKCTLKNTVTLKTVKVRKSAKKIVLTAKLKKGSKVLKNKKVTFKFNGKTFKAKTNSKGIAKVTVNSKNFMLLRVGSTIYYQVTYAKLHVKKLAKVYK